MTLLSVGFDPTDLHPMSIPLLLHIINLEKNWIRAIKKPYVHFSHPGIQFHNPGEDAEMHCGRVLNGLGCLVKTICHWTQFSLFIFDHF